MQTISPTITFTSNFSLAQYLQCGTEKSERRENLSEVGLLPMPYADPGPGVNPKCLSCEWEEMG